MHGVWANARADTKHLWIVTRWQSNHFAWHGDDARTTTHAECRHQIEDQRRKEEKKNKLGRKSRFTIASMCAAHRHQRTHKENRSRRKNNIKLETTNEWHVWEQCVEWPIKIASHIRSNTHLDEVGRMCNLCLSARQFLLCHYSAKTEIISFWCKFRLLPGAAHTCARDCVCVEITQTQ